MHSEVSPGKYQVIGGIWLEHIERLQLLVVGSWLVGSLVGTFGHELQETIQSLWGFLIEAQV